MTQPTSDSRPRRCRALLAGALLLAAAPLTAAEHILLADADAWRYASSQFRGAAHDPGQLELLPLINLSNTQTDDGLDDADSAARFDHGGVPLATLERLWLGQLLHTGAVQAQRDARWQAQLLVRDWQAPDTALRSGGWFARLGGQSKRLLNWLGARDPDALVTLELRLTDRWQQLPPRQFTVTARLPDCADLSALHAESGDARDANLLALTRSTIGRSALAAINRLVEEALAHADSGTRSFRISHVRGETIFIHASAQDFRVGDLLPIYHQDKPDKQLGDVRVSAVTDHQVHSFPVNFPAGQIAGGDIVRVREMRRGPLLQDAGPAFVNCRAQEEVIAYDPDQARTE